MGFSETDAAGRIGVRLWQLQAAEEGADLLTLRQAERAAAAYDVPLAVLFCENPPAEEPQAQQFRRLPGTPVPPWPPPMRALARRVGQRQQAAAELRELLEEDTPWAAVVERFGDGREAWAEVARDALGIGLDEQLSWRDTDGYVPLRRWIDAVETLGVLVMQDGSMPVDALRGFAAPHVAVPVIVLNTNDDPRARAFTLMHELAHLLLAVRGRPVDAEAEEWCDGFAGDVLMPRATLAELAPGVVKPSLIARVDELALRFGVTPLAMAIRLGRLGLLPRDELREVIREIKLRPPRQRGDGGDYYKNEIARLGPSFIRLVLTALEGQALTYSSASTLLNVKVNRFDRLRGYVDRRTEFA